MYELHAFPQQATLTSLNSLRYVNAKHIGVKQSDLHALSKDHDCFHSTFLEIDLS